MGKNSSKGAVAVIDIGSNSVRLVVYDGLVRSLTPIFNEKTLCGLGREVRTTGQLPADAVTKALAALKRFRGLCKIMKVGRIYRRGDGRLPRSRQRTCISSNAPSASAVFPFAC